MRFEKLTRDVRRIMMAGVWGAAVAAFVPGCAPQVPPGTRLLASGNIVVGTAPEDGTAYVVEKETNALLYTGRVKKGDSVSVEPGKQLIELNGQPAEQRIMRLDHTYEVRFLGAP